MQSYKIIHSSLFLVRIFFVILCEKKLKLTNTRMKNILIIGSTGQIGSELTMHLRNLYGNEHVVAGYIPGAEPKGALAESGPSMVVDITNAAQIAEAVDRYHIDTIYNLAALLSAVAESKPQLAWHIGIDGLLNVLEDKNALQADATVEEITLTDDLLKCLNVLNEREQRVINLYYGNGYERQTMAEIAETMGLKRERVRQVRDTALRKLRKAAKKEEM